MHISFIPYGKRECVERFLRDMEAQKHKLFMTKDDKKQFVFIDGQVRVLPFGVMEYVFPKEDKNLVLNTLGFNNKVPYGMGKAVGILRRLLGHKKVKSIDSDGKYLWNRDHVSILPIGFKEDLEIVGTKELDLGWKHEAI